jgi:hypothetical protein
MTDKNTMGEDRRLDGHWRSHGWMRVDRSPPFHVCFFFFFLFNLYLKTTPAQCHFAKVTNEGVTNSKRKGNNVKGGRETTMGNG